MDLTEEGIYSDYDFYDYDKVEKVHEKHIRRQVQLRMKIREAVAKGDQKAIDKAKEAFRNHSRKGDQLKQKARAAHYPWY